jgi:sulfopyruvate decarboxylase subunit alpha
MRGEKMAITAEITEGMRGQGLVYNVDNARIIHEGLKEAGIKLIASVPDSWNREVRRLVANDREITYVPCTREDQAVAVAMGGYLGGKRSAVIMEGSGFGSCPGVLARPGFVQRMPVLLVASHTATMGEMTDSHSESKYLCEPILRALNIPHHLLMDINHAKLVIREAQATIDGQLIPFAILLPRHILWKID